MKKLTKSFLLICTAATIVACNPSEEKAASSAWFEVKADAETTPAEAMAGDDAADDPAIWYNAANPEGSIIIGTNKKRGLETYTLKGDRLASYPVGLVNNVDVAYGFSLDSTSIDLVATTNRSTNAIDVFKINSANGALEQLTVQQDTTTIGEVYGLCMHKSPTTGNFYIFISGKEGIVEQYLVLADTAATGGITLQRIAQLNMPSQTEGLVADKDNNVLYAAVEDMGIYRIPITSDQMAEPTLIENTTDSNPNLAYDIEGLSIYYAANGAGYLLASSQGNNSYAVFTRTEGNTYLGSFRVVANGIDGTTDTDGIDVSHLNLGPEYPRGVFICQDGNNETNGKSDYQNFKLVGWEKIEEGINNFPKK
jgi:3-phytase